MFYSAVINQLIKIFHGKPFRQTQGGEGERLKCRIVAYRTQGSTDDGVHVVVSAHRLDDLDFTLMRADISCSKKRHPAIPDSELIEGRWYTIEKNSELAKREFLNSHGSSDDGGTSFYNETAFLGLPRSEYQVSPEEVVWHKLRVDQLRTLGVPLEERLHVLAAERALSPWTNKRAG